MDTGRDGRGDELPDELRELGRRLRVPDVGGETMAERVLARIVAEGVGVEEPPRRAERLRAWARARWRALVTALCGLLAVLVLTPPVRAAVADWFDFGGVEVRYAPSAPAPSGAVVPGCGRGVPMAEAERLAGFRPVVPAGGLGRPDAVAVSEGPEGRRVVSLCWRAGTAGSPGAVRLDQFRARLDPSFGKTSPVRPEWLEMRSGSALWFAKAHRLEFPMRDPEGKEWRTEYRAAGPTLLWVHEAGLTLRLEGIGTRARAVAVAESLEIPSS